MIASLAAPARIRHGRATRLVALLGLLLLPFVGTREAFGFHGCQHHEAAGATGDAAQPVAHQHAHDAAHADARHPEQPHPEHEGCSCVGDCAVGAGLAAPRAAELGAAEVLGAPARAMPAFAAELPGRAPHTLPFALAPPVHG